MPTQAQLDAAVKKAVDEYKQKVTEVAKRYQQSGDLCDEEARNIQDDLGIDLDLNDDGTLRLVLGGEFKFEYSGEYKTGGQFATGSREWVKDSALDKFARQVSDSLRQGVTVTLGNGEEVTISTVGSTGFVDEFEFESD